LSVTAAIEGLAAGFNVRILKLFSLVKKVGDFDRKSVKSPNTVSTKLPSDFIWNPLGKFLEK
jgi:hypothetical protein